MRKTFYHDSADAAGTAAAGNGADAGASANASAAASATADARPHVPVEAGIGGDYEIIDGKRVLVRAATVDHPAGNRPRFADGAPMAFKGSAAVKLEEAE